jgi:ADP-heptose:LPS heptosyltransferase
MTSVFFGPYTGEFGFEVGTVQGWFRHKAKEYDIVYVSSFANSKSLYTDFANFIPHTFTTRQIGWDQKAWLRGHRNHLLNMVPKDITTHILYPTEDMNNVLKHSTFIKFGINPIQEFDYLVHAKSSKKSYPYEYWKTVVSSLEGRIASIGLSSEDYVIENTYDLRDIPLAALMNYIAGSKVVIGQSSGVMHLSCHCGTDVVVWGPGSTGPERSDLRKRYVIDWNPFNVNVQYVVDNNWCPTPNTILSNIQNLKEVQNDRKL